MSDNSEKVTEPPESGEGQQESSIVPESPDFGTRSESDRSCDECRRCKVECGLEKPSCSRCENIGGRCTYNERAAGYLEALPDYSYLESRSRSARGFHLAGANDSNSSPKYFKLHWPQEVTSTKMGSDNNPSVPDDEYDFSFQDDLSFPAVDPRISDASQYLSQLESLQREISMKTLSFAPENVASRADIPGCRFLFYDGFFASSVAEDNEVIICRKLAMRILANVQQMELKKFCQNSISIFVMESGRPVAKLQRLHLSPIKELCSSLHGDDISKARDAIRYFDLESRQWWSSSRDWSMITNLVRPSPEPLFKRAALFLVAIELALVSYCGTHTEQLQFGTNSEDIREYCIASSDGGNMLLSLKQRSLQCLNHLLGGKRVWVFQEATRNSDESLALSTDIETLTDLWGPSWRIVDTENPRKDSKHCIKQYNIGNGSILPWSANPLALETERSCHWMSSKQWNCSEIDRAQAGIKRRYLSYSDTLLIGSPGCVGLSVNLECSIQPEQLRRLKSQYLETSALKAPRTDRPRRYLSEQSIQVSANAMGIVSAAGTLAYKRRSGHTLKDVLVERWRNGVGNPVELEAFSGVEVSLCTKNARRRRLLYLLGSSTMKSYLNGMSFWSKYEECRKAFYEALRSPRHFRYFWITYELWHEKIREAISVCLDELQQTGVEDQTKSLNALWVETFDEEGESDGESVVNSDEASRSIKFPGHKKDDFQPVEKWIVAFSRKEHSWTGFLQDSPECLTMAITSGTCLDFSNETSFGRRCSKNTQDTQGSVIKSLESPVLQTALLVNASMPDLIGLCRRTFDDNCISEWDATSLAKKTKFYLGHQGTLKVYEAAKRDCPAIMSWEPVTSKRISDFKNISIMDLAQKQVLGMHHREYIGGSWDTKPLPVLILSEYVGSKDKGKGRAF